MSLKRKELQAKYPEETAYNTGEVINWLQNDEFLYTASKRIKTPVQLSAFWRANKPRGASVAVLYVDWEEVYNTIKEE